MSKFDIEEALELIEEMRMRIFGYMSTAEVPYPLTVDLSHIDGELAVTAYRLKHDWDWR